MYVCMDGRMDGWMDGWMDEWMDVFFYFTSDKTNESSYIIVHINTHKNELYVRNEVQNMSVTFDTVGKILTFL